MILRAFNYPVSLHVVLFAASFLARETDPKSGKPTILLGVTQEQSDCGEANQTVLPEEELVGNVPFHNDRIGQEPEADTQSGDEHFVTRSFESRLCRREEEGLWKGFLPTSRRRDRSPWALNQLFLKRIIQPDKSAV